MEWPGRDRCVPASWICILGRGDGSLGGAESMALESTYGNAELVKRDEELNSAARADAQQGMRVMHPRIRSLVHGRTVVGPVFTVRAFPGSMMTVQKAMLEARPGQVLVVDAGGDLLAGGLW